MGKKKEEAIKKIHKMIADYIEGMHELYKKDHSMNIYKYHTYVDHIRALYNMTVKYEYKSKDFFDNGFMNQVMEIVGSPYMIVEIEVAGNSRWYFKKRK